MLTTLRRLLLISAGAIALSGSGLAQVSDDLQKTLSQATAAYDRADYPKASRWLHLAAEQGDAGAQFFLGFMYDFDEGVSHNYMEAVRWARLAAEQGDAEAQFSLGLMYDSGQGVTKNYAEAARWHRLAAEQGDVFAQSMLGFKYALGKGVPQNYIEGYKWLSLAAAQGDGNAAKGRDLVRGEMTPAEIAVGQRLSAAWRPKR